MEEKIENTLENNSLKGLTSGYGKLNKKQNKLLQELTRHHINAFNFAVDEGLKYAVEDIKMQETLDPNGRKIQMFIEDVAIGYPTLPDSNVYTTSVQIFPAECRERGSSYTAPLTVTICYMLEGRKVSSLTTPMGQIPVMVKSKRCRIYNMSPAELVKHHEEAEEMGGYFIINGNEKLMRMLIVLRRNYPLAIVRPSWCGKGPQFTEYGCMMRCVKRDESQTNMTMHYCTNGSLVLAFARNKELFYVPLIYILKALSNVTDLIIFKEMIKGRENDAFLKGCVSSMIRDSQKEVFTRADALKYIGERFRYKLSLPSWKTDEMVCYELLKDNICAHLDNNSDKFNMLIFMARKTYSLANGQCMPETADSPMNQEILMGGHLYLMLLKSMLSEYLRKIRFEIDRNYESKDDFDINNAPSLKFIMDPKRALPIAKLMEKFLATGSIWNRADLNLQQATGFTIVTDKLNYLRYISHFRAVHRGAFFAQMKSTSVRKLLPEAWGFICPVHTPDGAPCGLLNHLSANCKVIIDNPRVNDLPKTLSDLGMIPLVSPLEISSSVNTIEVVLNGRVLGVVNSSDASELVRQLRVLKTTEKYNVPSTLEIGYVPLSKCGQYPGIFLFTTPSRMMRPVFNLITQSQELIGSFEQVYMNIAVTPDEVLPQVTTHIELSQGSILSAVASMTPFTDFNPSPRNIYQCQMAKQTMGTPAHSLQYRSDNKMYKLQTPQSPLVRTNLYNEYDVDNYPLGTNAIVAVISYTGYDMEDAIILNRSSVQRGFAHASVYKTELIDLAKRSHDRNASYQFGVLPSNATAYERLDEDGLPHVGSLLQEGDPFYSYIDLGTNKCVLECYKAHEPAYVDQVKLLGSESGNASLDKVFIKLRLNRNPIIGDKFASRHGQKGICSQLWPLENMPFCESGMVPDIIFNPHGFPSRMTVGMMIESMAGKSAALHGIPHDSTPFAFSEDTPAIDHFAKLLNKAGYNYYGNERLYSGIDGREFEADIFFGVVYYQRLRHMVSDKFQVRTTGPIDMLTQQPVKGRSRCGGIRFGEMERDCLLAHGASFLLQDRLFNCSDKSFTRICKECGSIISPICISNKSSLVDTEDQKWVCQTCDEGGHIETISVPYVFRYFVSELAAMNISIKIESR